MFQDPVRHPCNDSVISCGSKFIDCIYPHKMGESTISLPHDLAPWGGEAVPPEPKSSMQSISRVPCKDGLFFRRLRRRFDKVLDVLKVSDGSERFRSAAGDFFSF